MKDKKDFFLKQVSFHVELNEHELDLIYNQLQHIELTKKEKLVSQGDSLNLVYFVINGCLRSFHLDKTGTEHVMQFAPEGFWISDMNAFITNEKSFLTIEAIENSNVFCLSRQDQSNLFQQIPKLERFFRIITEKSIAKTNSRMMQARILTALERYDYFCKDYPALIHRLSQKQIASYISVTPEFLSKIKAESLRKK